MAFGLRALHAILRITNSIDTGIEVIGNRHPPHHARGNTHKKLVPQSH